jgi:hypothetical protein
MVDPIHRSTAPFDGQMGLGEQAQMENAQTTLHSADDLPQEQIAAAKQKARVNALILIAVFLLIAIAPFPWNALAPLLFLIPLFLSLSNRLRGSRSAVDALTEGIQAPADDNAAQPQEPYSYSPSDPADPRKYKPID